MQTILLPTDFSATAKNAALYALQLAEQLGATNLVLYNSYEIPVTIDPLVPGLQMLDIESLKKNSEKGLANFELEIRDFANNINISSISEFGDLSSGLDELCAKLNAGLVVMGITGGGILEEKLIGSNTISVAKHTKTPLIIVPANTSFTRIEEIMLTNDFDKDDKSVPVDIVRQILAETKAKLFIFNVEEDVDEGAVKYPSNVPGEGYALHALLQDLNPEYHFSQNKNQVEAINQFALEYQVDLIISIHKKHGFFESLFSRNHTKELAFHTHVPLMVIRS